MLDPNIITKMVEDQISKSVNDQLLEVFASDDWLKPLEQQIIKYSQDAILKKFSNSSSMPEIIDAAKTGLEKLFNDGNLPGIDQYVDRNILINAVNQVVEKTVATFVEKITKDPKWIDQIQNTISQTVTQTSIHRVMSALDNLDVSLLVSQRVDERMNNIRGNIFPGIQDTATTCELTILDQHVVVENTLTANTIEAINSLSVKDLIVTGGINTDNHSWHSLTNNIIDKVYKQLSDQWRTDLVDQTYRAIKVNGINFDNVKVDNELLINNNCLASTVKESSLQTVGPLRHLTVTGEAQINETLTVTGQRIGINTQEPEMALSVWDEDVSIIAGKFKNKTAYIGTSRASGLTIGVNRVPAVEIDVDGLTAVKKLQIGVHRIQHNNDIPNWSGTKGDVVFNANPTEQNNVFAWQCLGGHRWKIIRSV